MPLRLIFLWLLFEQVYEASRLLQKLELSLFNLCHFRVLATSSGAISVDERLIVGKTLSADFLMGRISLTVLFTEQKLAKSILSHFVVSLRLRW